MKIPLKDIVFVLLQFLLFVLFVFDIKVLTILFPEILFWLGVGMFVAGALITSIAVLQLNIHLSPFPSPLPGARLIQNGIYKFVRHPIYSGIILAFFGFSIISDSGYRLIISILLFVLFYFKTNYEEKQLMDVFSDYGEYQNHTGRFFPKLW